jgi:hypothetical protein
VAVTRSEEGDRQLYSLIDSPLTGARISIDFASRILLIINQVCRGWSGGTFRTGFCFKVVDLRQSVYIGPNFFYYCTRRSSIGQIRPIRTK